MGVVLAEGPSKLTSGEDKGPDVVGMCIDKLVEKEACARLPSAPTTCVPDANGRVEGIYDDEDEDVASQAVGKVDESRRSTTVSDAVGKDDDEDVVGGADVIEADVCGITPDVSRAVVGKVDDNEAADASGKATCEVDEVERSRRSVVECGGPAAPTSRVLPTTDFPSAGVNSLDAAACMALMPAS